MQAEEAEVEEYQLSTVKIADLIFDKSNPNRPSKEVIEGIRKSILEFGLIKPLVINEKMEIADGEHRALVWKALGKTDIQAYIVPKLNDDIKRRLARQTLNKLQGEHDIKLDADEMALIFEAGQLNNLAELIAQGRESLENILTKHKGIQFQHEDNFDVDKALEDLVPETKLGDIWQLGQHRIICADCSDERSIKRLMEDRKADMVFTDPPYGVEYQEGIAEIQNDKKEGYYDFIIEGLKTISRILKEDGVLYLFSADRQQYNILQALATTDLEIKCFIVWVKNAATWGSFLHRTGIIHYAQQHEFILYCKKKDINTKSLVWNGGFDQVTVWNYDKPLANKEHPTMKPIELISRAIRNSSNEDQIIFDPFLGSGSTMIACEQTNRVCMGVEIDPHYVDVCVKRWEAYTNQKAILLPRGE